jgi:serine/threonine-protein kinase
VFLLDTEAKEVRIVDFGAALIVGGSRLTRQGVVFGTPHYMSPEQAAGKPVDHRVDIYALGVILYEMVTGHVPFEGDTYMGVLTQHMFATPKPPSQAVPELDGKLGAIEAVVLRALEKDPSARYATMREASEAITQALDSGLVGPAPTSRRSRPAPQTEGAELPTLVEIRERVSHVEGLDRRRGSRVVVAVVLAGVLGLGGLIVGMRLHSTSETPHADAGLVVSVVEAGPSVMTSMPVQTVDSPATATESTSPASSAPPPSKTTTVRTLPTTPKPPPTQTTKPSTNSLGPDPFGAH